MEVHYDANGNLKHDNRPCYKTTYLYDYRNRLIGVRPERWDVYYNTSYEYSEPGEFIVQRDDDFESRVLSFEGRNNTGYKYALRQIPEVDLSPGDAEAEFEFEFKRAAHIDQDRFKVSWLNEQTGAKFQVHYYYRSRDFIVRQYTPENGFSGIYVDYYFPGLESGTHHCRIVVENRMIYFYLDGDLLDVPVELDGDMAELNAVKVTVKEGHYHFDNIINSEGCNLDFEDGPYAKCSDYVYNANDERVMKISYGSYPFKSYIYDGNGKVLSEYKTNRYGSTSLKYNYLYGKGQKLARVNSSGTTEYYHNNYLGSAQAITNSSGTVTWSRDYYPFGSDKDASGSGNDYKFCGKEHDDESGLKYYWKRHYDSEIGAFIQPQFDSKSSISRRENRFHYLRFHTTIIEISLTRMPLLV